VILIIENSEQCGGKMQDSELNYASLNACFYRTVDLKFQSNQSQNNQVCHSSPEFSIGWWIGLKSLHKLRGLSLVQRIVE